MSILVTGATGTNGRPLALRLAASGQRVRALVRDPSRARDLADAGVALVSGHFDDPGSLDRAMADVETVALITPPGAGAQSWAESALAAVARQRVPRVVRLSALRADLDGPTVNTRQHGAVDARIRETVERHVIVRPHMFLQNLLWSAGSILDGQLVQGSGPARLGLVDTRDVVDVLTAVVTDRQWDGRTLDPTGPAALTMDEVASLLSDGLGREVRHLDVGPEGLRQGMAAAGLDPFVVQLTFEYATAYRAGFGDFVTDDVLRVTGHPPRSAADFVREVFVPAVRR